MNNKTKLVVKSNALIEASFNLSLVEQRVLLLAIVEAREIKNLTPSTALEITAKTYNNQYNVGQAEAYNQLVEASKQLFNRQFSYLDTYKGVNAITVSRWVKTITYVKTKGTVVLYLSDTVITMISRLEAHFTKYLLDQVAMLKSQYSIRFYELFARYLPLGNSKKFEVLELRKLLDIADNEYKSVAYLKRDVIDKAVNEINKKTDITVSYEQFKQGRTITHILFKMKQKPQPKTVVQSEKPKDLTEKQLDMFADRLAQSEKFQAEYVADVGATIDQYAQQIKEKLKQPKNVQQWLPHLKEVGYKTT
nr:replication initiation protein RepM [Acinetobacter sp. HY1485]